MRLSTLILLSSVAVAIVPHVQVERATPGEEDLGSISAVAARSLYCHRGFFRPQWQICGRKICLFPQFTASFIIFHETILVFTIFNPKLMVFRSGK